MERLLRDRYLWFIAATMVLVVILLYPAETYFKGWRPSNEEWYFTYMTFQRVLLLITVAITAWRFGVKGGMVACLAVGLIVLPYVIGMMMGQWRPDLLAEYMIMGAIAIVLSWLIGSYEKEKQLLEKSHDQLEIRVQERTTQLFKTNEQLERELNERKRAEEELKLKAELLDAVTDSIFVHDFDGNFVYLNEAAYKSRGYTRDELMGLKLQGLHPSGHSILTKLQIEAMRAKGGTIFESVNLRKDKSVMPVEVHSRIVKSGGRDLVLSVAYDITERKQAEERFQELYQREQTLRRELEGLYQREQTLRRELEEQMRRRIEFTRALVHELKTPLTAVVASSEALVNELKDEPGPRLARNIYRGACNLDRRIDELLDLAKSEVGALSLNCETVDPLKLIREVAEDMSPAAAKKEQSLVLEVPASLPPVWADEERLRQILLNLISNALKFNRKKGRVTLRAEEKDASVVFEVRDEGEGITEEAQQRLFQPYHRPESDRDRLHGLGLGLALSKTLVELHHGQIWVKSQKGSGSTFGFSLPSKDAVQQGNGDET